MGAARRGTTEICTITALDTDSAKWTDWTIDGPTGKEPLELPRGYRKGGWEDGLLDLDRRMKCDVAVNCRTLRTADPRP